MDNTENSGKRVAIQGYSGCFHEQAARIFYGKYDGSTPVSVECPTFDDLYRSLDTGRADAAIMAIENTVSGGLLPNFELLRKYNVKIKGEVFLRIQQNLMALPGQKIEDIKEVRTHYMAINQTRPFFQSYPWIRLVESEDTAKSAADVAEQKLQGVGAVASLLAADLYGLEVLKESIETYKQNFTRFLILDDGITVPKEKVNKVSMCFTLPHKSGSLAQILTNAVYKCRDIVNNYVGDIDKELARLKSDKELYASRTDSFTNYVQKHVYGPLDAVISENQKMAKVLEEEGIQMD